MDKIKNNYKRKLIKLLKALRLGDPNELIKESDDRIEAMGRIIAIAAEEGARVCPIEQVVEIYNQKYGELDG